MSAFLRLIPDKAGPRGRVV